MRSAAIPQLLKGIDKEIAASAVVPAAAESLNSPPRNDASPKRSKGLHEPFFGGYGQFFPKRRFNFSIADQITFRQFL